MRGKNVCAGTSNLHWTHTKINDYLSEAGFDVCPADYPPYLGAPAPQTPPAGGLPHPDSQEDPYKMYWFLIFGFLKGGFGEQNVRRFPAAKPPPNVFFPWV
jgi:hypothetical protein